MNQKSLDKNKPKELEWEKQFDERFNGELWFGYDEQELPKNEQSESRLEVKYFIKTILEKNNYDWSELLQKQRTELLEEIMKLEIGEFEGWDLAKKFNCCPGDDMADAYNQALKDVIKNLKQK